MSTPRPRSSTPVAATRSLGQSMAKEQDFCSCGRICAQVSPGESGSTHCCPDCKRSKQGCHSAECNARGARFGSMPFSQQSKATRKPELTISRFFIPGGLTLVTALSVLAVGLLDALCCLPHPESAVPGAFPKQAISTVPLRGLPSQEVRLNYKARLETWNKQLESYRRNLTFANIELVMGNEIGLGAVADAKPAACKLAAASVRERHAARVEARLQGSVGIHLCLIFRDLLVYRSLSPFTFEAMMENRRAKIKATNGIEPTDDEVCQALMDASQRTSK